MLLKYMLILSTILILQILQALVLWISDPRIILQKIFVLFRQTTFSSTYAITVGHGKRIPITHIGPTTLSSPNFVGYFLLKMIFVLHI